jgi:hypothetical protein
MPRTGDEERSIVPGEKQVTAYLSKNISKKDP